MAGPVTFRRILCPVDFSTCSRDALRYGAEIARRTGGTLTVLFVNDPLLGPAAAAAGYNVRKLAQETTTELQRFVKRSLNGSTSGATIATALGHAAPEILNTARQLDADLIVMGSRGLGAPAKWIAGSTTERVLRTTPVPVLIIPCRPRSRARQPLRTWPGPRTVVAVDVPDTKAAEVRAAIAVADSFSSTPIFLHVLPDPSLPPWLSAGGRKSHPQRVRSARQALSRLTGPSAGALEIAVGRLSDQIIAAGDRLKAGLIIMTLKRSTSPFGPRRGVITYQVLCRHTVPVLALPSQ